MFKFDNGNVGPKIKKVAKVYFWIITIVGILFAAIMIFGGFASRDSYYSSSYLIGGASVISGIIIGGIYVLVAYLAGLMLYAYGALVETNYENTQQQEEIIDQLNEIRKAIPTTITIVKEETAKKETE